jgi:hypothetical protein
MRLGLALILLLSTLGLTCPARAYSLLTHEQLIDLTWDTSIVPLILSRYPTLTPAQLEQARAYAYGGCVIQDIGYYPLGDVFFSDLTHYVRSGDFVVNLFRDAQNANELAFAIGALSHYIGDSVGHSQATNLAVPVEFPELAARYGSVVSYAEGEHQHVQTEFAFDINEIAHQRFAPVRYLRHIGLAVPTQQLSLAFYQTYGLHEDFQEGRSRRINVDAYRFAVHRFIPRIAFAVTILHRKHEPSDTANADLRRLQTELAAVAQENNWNAYRGKAGIGTHLLAGFIFIIPKVGPIKLVAVKGPTQSTEVDYVHSVLRSTDLLNLTLEVFTPNSGHQLTTQIVAAPPGIAATPPPSTAANATATEQTALSVPFDSRHPLANRDLDTGLPVRPATYSLTDATYANLLHRIAENPTQPIPPGVKSDILAYYANPDLPFATKKHPDRWEAVQHDLIILQTVPVSNEAEPFPVYRNPDSIPNTAPVP